MKIWDLSRGGDAEWANPDSPGPADFASNEQVVAPGRDGKTPALWDARNAQRLRLMDPGPFAISTLTVSPDRRTVAAGGSGRSQQCGGEMAGLWDIRTGVHRFVLDHCSVADVAFRPDGQYIATAEFGGDVPISWVPGGAPIGGIGDDGYSMSRARFSPDGRLLAIAEVNVTRVLRPNRVPIWDWQGARLLHVIPAGTDVLLDFDPTGPRIVLIGEQGRAEIWNVLIPKRLTTLEGRPGRVSDLAFSPDGRLVATAGDDGTIRLFDARTGAQRLVLQHGACRVSDVAFSPDSTKLASTSPCEGVRIWALDIDDLLRIARQNVTRSLTDLECRQYLHVNTCPRI